MPGSWDEVASLSQRELAKDNLDIHSQDGALANFESARAGLISVLEVKT